MAPVESSDRSPFRALLAWNPWGSIRSRMMLLVVLLSLAYAALAFIWLETYIRPKF